MNKGEDLSNICKEIYIQIIYNFLYKLKPWNTLLDFIGDFSGGWSWRQCFPHSFHTELGCTFILPLHQHMPTLMKGTFHKLLSSDAVPILHNTQQCFPVSVEKTLPWSFWNSRFYKTQKRSWKYYRKANI